MAGLCWMAVTLAFFLSAENTLAVDQNRLAEFVNGTLEKYGPQGMFSLAVRIPEDQDQKIEDILKKVYESDLSNKVSEKLNNREVYIGSRVVAAKVLTGDTGADHAESQVVDHLNDLFKTNNKSDLMLFYVNAFPCVDKCTNQGKTESILEKINDLSKWNSHALVFSKTFKPSNGPSNTEEELRGALTRLGSKIGLDNIFRCDKKAGRMQCISCSSNGQVTRACVSDDSQPGHSSTAQGVESHRYRRGVSFKTSGGYVHKKGVGHAGGANFEANWSTKRFGGYNGDVNVGGSWASQKGVGSSGRMNAGGSFYHNGGHGGNLNVNAGFDRNKAASRGGWSASGQWGKGGSGQIIRAE